MKIHLSEISAEGLEHRLSQPLSTMGRLVELLGPQEGLLEAELLLKNHQGHVEISGRIEADIRTPCQRCLDAVSLPLEEELLLYLAPAGDYERRGMEELELGRADLEMVYYEGEVIDLSHLLEDELLLLVPEVVTDEDEDGRCTICGKDMDGLYSNENAGLESHPFAQLKDWIKPDKED